MSGRTLGQTLGLIPARGGSKRLPGKNLMDAGGKSLLARAVEAGLSARLIDRLIVSTDDAGIAEAARACGAETPFLRPADLATDAASSLDVVRHAIDWIEAKSPGRFSHVVLLQPTSPLRTAADVDATIALCRDEGRSTAVSVTRAAKAETLLVRHAPGVISRPADDGEVWALNGAVYVLAVAHVRAGGGFVAPDTGLHPMDAARSADVDTAEDLAAVRAALASGT